MIKSYSVFLNIILLVFFTSCVKNLDEAYIPSYIKIDKIEVITTGAQGSSSSYITDAWVYIDGAEMGAFPLPAIIPILAGGKHEIKVAPGIKLNGVSTTRVPYPMVEPVEYEMELFKDSILDIDVECSYFSTSQFALIEAFERSNSDFETTINNLAQWRVSSSSTDPPSYIFEGNHSSMAILDDEGSYWQIKTKEMIKDLPKNGVPVFIELNFKTNTTVVLSMVPYIGEVASQSEDIIYLNPTDEWKKIYINLTSTISYDVNHNNYRFLLSAEHTNGTTQSIVLIDNFKVVYREIN